MGWCGSHVFVGDCWEQNDDVLFGVVIPSGIGVRPANFMSLSRTPQVAPCIAAPSLLTHHKGCNRSFQGRNAAAKDVEFVAAVHVARLDWD